MELEGNVAIVTGGAGAIGREIVLRFVENGVTIVAVDVNEDGLERVLMEVKARGGSGLIARADVTERQEIESAVSLAIKNFGKIDILVNNAGYLKYAPFLEFKEDDWDRLIAVDLKGYFLFGQAVAREMVKKHYGKVINIASVGGEVGFRGACAYASAKAGVIGLTRVMALELAPHGINVNALSPGPTETKALTSSFDQKDQQARINHIPLGRLGSTEDVARAALFLASGNSAFITGHVLYVDGGFLAAGMNTKL
jgi:NAD(P)-dependent dehydrogenase (short-subunit alcohol dehydrogenase family)